MESSNVDVVDKIVVSGYDVKVSADNSHRHIKHILGYTTLKIVGPTYICKLKVLIIFPRVMF